MADDQHEEVSKKVSAEEEIRRGITVMRRVVQGRSRGIILDVYWSNQGQLIEPNGHTLTSFIGALVRNEIPITCDDWRNKELNESKEKIWSEIKRCFNIEEERRGFCMKLAGKLLRGFQTFLSSKFLKDADGNFVDAELPKKYESLISAEEWEAFKSKRQDPVFQRISATNWERASSPTYPYRKGRVGYGRLEQSMLQKEESSETSLPAQVLWKEARVGKSGVPQEEVLHVYQKCEELSQSLSPDDTKGILSRALDVPKYSGRVRGKGFGVTPTSLSIKKGKAPSNRELHARLEAMQAEHDALRREREASASTVYRDASDKDSINCTFQPNIPEGISHCQLYLSSPYYRMVGKGKVHNVSGVLLHTRELPAGCLKVSVDIAVEPNAALPYPSDDSDATTVHEAVGSFVAWPTNLICVGYETPTKSKSKDNAIPRHTESTVSRKELQENEVSNASAQQKKEVSNASARVKSYGAKKTVARKKPTTKYRSCLRTFLEMTDIPTGGVRTLHMEVGIFGFDYDQMIGNEDFMQVFSHEEIGVTVVNTYIRFLYDKLMRPNGLDVSFGFLAPATVNLGLILSRPDTVTEYVLRILMDNKDAEKLFFIPFNTGGHWLLLAINPIREIVYYLDSLGNDWTTYPDMKVLIDTVLQAFRAQRDIQTSRRGANSITWIKVACPQQRNQIDCGYFMLRFMRDTLALGRLKIPTDYFDEFKCAFYTKDQVDEIKEEWCQLMIELNVCS
ncbi:hypothetical protein KIW84_035330 [Lathyrus oleraceus]|uniref:Ubiquitin-like protease family profile domain-containing protein n=4 Tax=Pisum sativum TaxID=3888 RepID=A0A9D5B5V2_PEA|nr:hypothetical protein KIW84_035330 [Pisum sativum]